MLFLATSEPVLSECFGDPKGTALLTIPERHEFADLMGRRQTGFIPGCLDHAGGELAGDGKFKVPADKEIGRMVDTFVRGNGQIVHTVEIFHEYPEIVKMISDDIHNKRRTWGVSLGKDLTIARHRPDIMSKQITHIGITPNPQYGDATNGPTWIHLAAKTPETYYSELKEKVLDKEPDLYMPKETRERLQQLIPPKSKSDAPPGLTSTPSAKESVSLPAAAIEPVKMSASPPEAAPQTPPAATPATDDVGKRYERYRTHFGNWLQRAFPNPENRNQRSTDPSVFFEAKGLKREYTDIVKEINPDQWPDDLLASMSALSMYLKTQQNETAEYAGKDLFKGNEKMVALTEKALADPLNPNNLEIVTAVMAAHSNTLKNQAEFEHKFKEHRAEFLAMEADKEANKRARDAMEVENQSLKRARDEFEKKCQEVLAEMETMKKARIEESQKGLVQSPLAVQSTVPGATAAGIAMSVASSKDTTATSSGLPFGKPYNVSLPNRHPDFAAAFSGQVTDPKARAAIVSNYNSQVTFEHLQKLFSSKQ